MHKIAMVVLSEETYRQVQSARLLQIGAMKKLWIDSELLLPVSVAALTPRAFSTPHPKYHLSCSIHEACNVCLV